MILEPSFWDFAIERERIRLRRKEGLLPPWTLDPILQTYSFTNVKRNHDRTTFLFIEEYYDVHKLKHPSPEALLNSAIFRLHGTIQSARAIGWTPEWNEDVWNELVNKNSIRSAVGEKIFTSAYMLPNCGDTRPKHYVIAEIINGVWKYSSEILDAATWEYASEIMKDNCWGLGSFLIKEILLDYMLITDWVPADWSIWSPIGPGGRRGASRIMYGDSTRISEGEALDIIRDVYENRHAYWPPEFIGLDLTDIQWICCEFDKYQRTKNNEGRPKRNFRPTFDTVTGPENP